jgi:hypothetical protein
MGKRYESFQKNFAHNYLVRAPSESNTAIARRQHLLPSILTGFERRY